MAALVFGEGPLTPANGFHSQADVVIDARLAADLLRAPMDRPEDVQPSSTREKVWVVLTNNDKRRPEQVDRANPRPENEFGHIIEMTPPDGDHAAHVFRWDVLIRCGDPRVAAVRAVWQTSEHGWFASPDNCAVDAQGRLWVTTDQGKNWAKSGKADGLYAVETDGVKRGLSRLFFRAPVGAELCGPCFTPDGETVFLAVQHPGRWGEGLEAVRAQLDLRGSGDAVAGFPARHAAPPRGRRRAQEGQRQDRGVIASLPAPIDGGWQRG